MNICIMGRTMDDIEYYIPIPRSNKEFLESQRKRQIAEEDQRTVAEIL